VIVQPAAASTALSRASMSSLPASASLAAASTLARAAARSRRVRMSAPPVASAASAATAKMNRIPLAGSMSLVRRRETTAASSASAPTPAVERHVAPSEAISGAIPYRVMTATCGAVVRSSANSSASTASAAPTHGRDRDASMAFSTTSARPVGVFE
jgi:hypothetical protein